MKSLLLFLFAQSISSADSLPVHESQNWSLLKFSNIPQNKVSFTNQGMNIRIDKSAGPIVYSLSEAKKFESISAEGMVKGILSLKDTAQGSKGNDDFVFRLGVVYEGQRILGFFEKIVAPPWVKKLYELAPKDTGIDHIHFFNVVNDKTSLGKSRTHPSSNLIRESFATTLQSDGTFKIVSKKLLPHNVLAIWISSDGDDTMSKYEVEVKNIKLTPP